MQNKNRLFSPVARGVSLALGVSLMAPIYAQDAADGTTAEDQDVEVIQVSGIRSSLVRAMDTKRESVGVVDAINSEDIGKFPDTNLAESLQRITGVSIDRQNGEGSRVTVRGLGPDFNLVTLNGRQLPTNSGFGRSFDFGDLASEGVSGVEVYKTGKAFVPSGGMGATINILSYKPLENPNLNASFGLKAVNDTSTITGEEFTPEFSGLFSETFLDDTLGIAIVGSFQERNNGAQSATTNFFAEVDGGTVRDGVSVDGTQPSEGDIVGLPRNIVYNLSEIERTRTNAQVTLQYEPMDDLTITLDYTYAEQEVSTSFNDVSYWVAQVPDQVLWSEGPIVSPLVYTEFQREPDFPHAAGGGGSRNELNSVGINFEWAVNDYVELTLDHHDSESLREPDDMIRGTNSFLTVAGLRGVSRASTTIDYRGDIPVTTTTANDPLSPDDMRLTGSVFGNSWAKMNIEQTQFSGKWYVDDDQTIDFGVGLSKVANFEASSNVQRNTWGQNQASALGSMTDLMTPASLSGVFDSFDSGGDINNNFFLFDYTAVAARAVFLESLDPSNPLYLAPYTENGQRVVGSCGHGFCPDFDPGFGNNFQEDTISAFLQYRLLGDWGDYPFSVLLGLRYEETDVTSSSASRNYTRVDWVGATEWIAIDDGTEVPSALEATYDNWLPSIDIDVDIHYDMKLRYSYSTTIARAGYGDLRGNLDISNFIQYNSSGLYRATGSIGNPGLLPYESENHDLSYEWYYDDASYFSIGYFSKSVSNFITRSEVEDVPIFPDLAFPGFGPLFEEAVAALGGTPSNQEIRDWIFTNRPDAPGVDAEGQIITGVVGRDGPATFDLSTIINGTDEYNLDGWEVAIQHDFEDTGFGFIANATFVDSDQQFDRFVNDIQFAVPGLSDTRNLIVYYDKDGIQVRVAYNWRDEWLSFAGGRQPGYVAAYEQIDLNASYDFDNGLVVSFEVINLTDETTRGFARDYLQVAGVTQTGPRYNVGFRYSF
ncbi:TonB-dependent receptor [Alteromonas sp. ASW11-36]|uniref:TonB-dependent receptor n=1 Tax=Alteromonas arenosi TaxID=3055817 RepID=A0ABT7SWL2_9ALTE|nr:TonB-dependent receptor [Alteromonas sp. ASW11-36]MDM7860389.1 TonB-dependent receptor [Alteromonas sp. ASW11-36]